MGKTLYRLEIKIYIFDDTLYRFSVTSPLQRPFMNFTEISACVRCPKYRDCLVSWFGSSICQRAQVTLTLNGLPQVVNTVICQGLSKRGRMESITSGLVQPTDMRTIEIWNLPSRIIISEVYSFAYQVLDVVSKTRFDREDSAWLTIQCREW